MMNQCASILLGVLLSMTVTGSSSKAPDSVRCECFKDTANNNRCCLDVTNSQECCICCHCKNPPKECSLCCQTSLQCVGQCCFPSAIEARCMVFREKCSQDTGECNVCCQCSPTPAKCKGCCKCCQESTEYIFWLCCCGSAEQCDPNGCIECTQETATISTTTNGSSQASATPSLTTPAEPSTTPTSSQNPTLETSTLQTVSTASNLPHTANSSHQDPTGCVECTQETTTISTTTNGSSQASATPSLTTPAEPSTTPTSSQNPTLETSTLQTVSTASNLPHTANSSHQGGDNAGAIAGAVVAASMLIIAVFIVLWWRRRRASKGRKSDETENETTTPSSVQSIVNKSFSSGENGTHSGHRYTHIDSVTSLHPSSLVKQGDESVSNELDDVAARKLPTMSALDDNYSLAQNPSGSQNQPFASAASVYSMARNPENTLTYFIPEEEGRVSSADDQDKGQYFILEEGAANDETDGKKGTQPQAALIAHGANVYSSLDSSARGKNSDAEYTPLSHTARDTQAPRTANPTTEGGKDNQYFILEESAAQDDKEEGQGAQYFILEEDAAGDDKEQKEGGQYFILEEDAADDGKKQEKGGQYVILEQEAAHTDNRSRREPQSDMDGCDGEYSQLDPPDRRGNSSGRDKEYTPLRFVSKEGPKEKPATTGEEYFDLESDYSLAKQV